MAKNNTVTQYEVLKGVPKPAISHGKSRTSKYPFATMEIGDHFVVTLDKCGKTPANAAARTYTKKHNPNTRFSFRKLSETQMGCWRDA